MNSIEISVQNALPFCEVHKNIANFKYLYDNDKKKN